MRHLLFLIIKCCVFFGLLHVLSSFFKLWSQFAWSKFCLVQNKKETFFSTKYTWYQQDHTPQHITSHTISHFTSFSFFILTHTVFSFEKCLFSSKNYTLYNIVRTPPLWVPKLGIWIHTVPAYLFKHLRSFFWVFHSNSFHSTLNIVTGQNPY